MRRLLLILLLAAATLSTAASAGAEGVPTTKITAGAAHKMGTFAKGWFVVTNTGTRPTLRTGGHVTLGNGRLHLAISQWTTAPLLPGQRRRLRFRAAIPKRLQRGEWRIDGCTHGQCLRVGRFWVVAGEGGRTPQGAGGKTPNGPGSGAKKSPSDGTTPKASCAPSTGALAFPVEEPFRHVGECGVEYFGFVPDTYDARTPMPLLIWAHGCGGDAEGDTWNVGSYTPEPGEGWLALSLGGRDGDCWNPLAASESLVMAALADFEAHFNVDRHRVILAGYSSGGDLAYRTGFRHSSTFAGLLIENSSPFRDTESTQAESLAAATTKFHIVHLAHSGDTTYPLATVQSETNAVKAAGFPLELIVKPGSHYDGNTDKDLQELLAPTFAENWTSP
jgi:predicted esterase